MNQIYYHDYGVIIMRSFYEYNQNIELAPLMFSYGRLENKL